MRTKHLKIALATVISLLFALTIICIVGWQTNDQHTVSREYAAISMPSSIQYSEKKWIDRQASDPAIESVWQYRYTIRGDKSSKQIATDIKNTLQKQGFSDEGDFPVDTPDQSSFKMQKGELRLYIDIGFSQEKDKVNDVIVEAQNGS